ncbi:MAG TPA: periplasmic heavy metal sensor [Thermoleophilia bacterium]|nr:periplasmic heavy metal sensor [Thermoleophilia bacterium]
MRTAHKVILAISLSFNLAFVAAFALAYFGWAAMSPNRGEPTATEAQHGPWWARDGLQLSSSQTHAFEQGDAELSKQVQQIDEHVATHRTELLRLLSEESPPSDQIETVLSEITQLQHEAQRLVVNSLIWKRNVLTDEQKAEFLDVLRRRLCPYKDESGRGRHCRGPRWAR